MTVRRPTRRTAQRINFKRIAQAALVCSLTICERLLPDGHLRGREWVSINPRRSSDLHAGSFSVNVTTGRWADFACGDRGGDLISLVAYVLSLSPRDAALHLADALGLNHE